MKPLCTQRKPTLLEEDRRKDCLIELGQADTSDVPQGKGLSLANLAEE